jgi:hypothetical protein
MRSAYLSALFLGVIAVAIAMSGCLKPEQPTVVKFVVPEGFRGAFRITAKAEAPVTVPSVKPHEINVVEIPAGGLVRMKDTSALILAHHIQCVTAGGKNIPYSKPEAMPKHIAIFPLYTESSGEYYYLIGTHVEVSYALADGKDLLKLGQQILPDTPENAP